VSSNNGRRRQDIRFLARPPKHPFPEARVVQRTTRRLGHQIRVLHSHRLQTPKTRGMGSTRPACGRYAHYRNALIPLFNYWPPRTKRVPRQGIVFYSEIARTSRLCIYQGTVPHWLPAVPFRIEVLASGHSSTFIF